MKDPDFSPDRPAAEPWAEKADQLATKLASVWIWTVFFGLNTGLSYSLASGLMGLMGNPMMWELMRRPGFGPGPGGPAGEYLVMAIPACYIVGVLTNVASWAFLYLYFSLYLLPTVLIREPDGADDRRRRMAATALRRTYLLVIGSGLARLVPEALMYALPLLSRP